ncbi:hypothetical protein YC2023_086361 [Brassica napus]
MLELNYSHDRFSFYVLSNESGGSRKICSRKNPGHPSFVSSLEIELSFTRAAEIIAQIHVHVFLYILYIRITYSELILRKPIRDHCHDEMTQSFTISRIFDKHQQPRRLNFAEQGGGNHGGDDMPGAGLVSTNPSDRMIRDASDKTTASDSLRVVEGSEADPPLATGAGVSVGYTTQVSTHRGCA